ncbi:MAG: endonuclease/exonuclease/phosphatase family protein [Myxococcales bacterium]|nr:endonuclease/exonuclease/phosphatase family protein [Myxococcales bacterium]
MRLRVIDWNVNGRRNVARQLAMMDELGWDVALLQEVRPSGFAAFRDHERVRSADHALRHRPDRAEPWGCAILVREPFELLASAPMVNLPSPERSLVGLVRCGELVFEVAALATPPASSGWKQLKAVQADAFADRWASRTHPLIAGLDRNAPRVDHPDFAQVVWFWEAEERLFGLDPKHDMRDVLRVYLDEHVAERTRIARERP